MKAETKNTVAAAVMVVGSIAAVGVASWFVQKDLHANPPKHEGLTFVECYDWDEEGSHRAPIGIYTNEKGEPVFIDYDVRCQR